MIKTQLNLIIISSGKSWTFFTYKQEKVYNYENVQNSSPTADHFAAEPLSKRLWGGGEGGGGAP